MTIATKTTIKTYFETGDFPTQQNFTDLIDSFLGLGETASQTVGGPITVSGVAIFRTGVTVSGATGLYGDITFGTSAASTARTSMGLGTAAVLNTGVSANNIPKLDSSNRLPAVDGSLLTNLSGRVACFQVTDATDISLSAVPTQINVGSTKSVTIPTKGRIEIVIASGQLITATAAFPLILGIRIGSNNYFPTITPTGGATYTPAVQVDSTGTFTLTGSYGGTGTITQLNVGSFMVGLDIEALSIPTGAQTVQLVAARSAGAGTSTLKGTVATSRIYITIYDHS